MFEGGNISGLLGMSNKSDGTGEAQAGYGGNYNQRRNSVRNHYIKTGYKAHKGLDIDPDTGEVLSYVPPKNTKNPYKKMAYKKPFYKGSNFKLPNVQPSNVLNLVLCAGIGLGGYIAYNKVIKPFMDSPAERAAELAEKESASVAVNTGATQATVIKNTQTTLAKQGYVVTDNIKKIAVYLHQSMNQLYPPSADIVKTISKMQMTTFRLVSTAYGKQDLPGFSIIPFVKNNGTLKDHLVMVLWKTDQDKISTYLSSII